MMESKRLTKAEKLSTELQIREKHTKLYVKRICIEAVITFQKAFDVVE